MTPSRQRAVPFYDYRQDFLTQEEELVALFRDAGRRGAFILQDDLTQFETALAEFTGYRYAIGVANATDALHLALRAVGIGPGDEVIFCSHTMAATAAAIHFAGATPVPVECGPDHLMDPASAARAITPQTRALLPTQLNGRCCDMQALGELAHEHRLQIIEDAAQSLGARYRGKAAGTFGAAGAISFYPAKILGCLGDGGAVLTSDPATEQRLRQLRDHGRSADGAIVAWGLNSRLDNLQAVFLNTRLAHHLEAAIERRCALARLYQERLAGCAEVKLPPPPIQEGERFDVFQNYEIEARRRDQLREFLRGRSIGTLLPWGGKAVHQWEGLGFDISLPYTEALFQRLLLLPLNPSLSDDDVHYVCDVIGEFYGGNPL